MRKYFRVSTLKINEEIMFKKLLLAASIAALTSTAAHVIVPAMELNLPNSESQFDVDSTFVLSPNGSFPTSSAFLLEITLPDGLVFGESASPDDLDGLDVPGQLDVTVSSGGAEGDSTVAYLVTAQAAGEASIQYSQNLLVTSCPAEDSPIVMQANLLTTPPVPIDGGIAVSDTVIATCASALNGEVLPEGNDTDIALGEGNTTFALFTEDGAAPTAGPVPIGTVDYSIDTGVSVDSDTPLSSGDVSSIEFDVEFGNVEGIALVELVLPDDTRIQVVPNPEEDGNSVTFLIEDSSQIDNLTGDNGAATIYITSEGETPIASQQVEVSNAVVSFVQDNGLDLDENEVGANGPIDPLQREGQTFGVFDWNSGSPAGTISFYRITGLDPESETNYTVTISNSAQAVNGTYPGVLFADETGEEIITSVGFGDAGVPAFVRADALINIETSDPIDVDRLLARNGIVTAFNDGSNNSNGEGDEQPSNDDDNQSDEENPVSE